MFRKNYSTILATLLLIAISVTCDLAYSASEMKFASWNIRILSDKSRDDAELRMIAKTLIDYDFISIVELRDEKVLQRTQKILGEMGKNYEYDISAAVGRGVKERVAFLYDSAFIEVVQAGELYPDEADGTDDFIRDPYYATFRAGKFDFSVIAVHIIWGSRVGDRRDEIMALAPVYAHVQKENGPHEDDILLVGDFNRDTGDLKAFGALMAMPSMTSLFHLPQKSHIKDSSLYDNILFQTDYVTEYTGTAGIDKFDETDFGNNDKAANDAVSDHRPVWATFRINTDDDGQIADVTGDGKVNALDLVVVAANFGTPKPIPTADITGDGEVNRKDILIVLDALEAALGESHE